LSFAWEGDGGGIVGEEFAVGDVEGGDFGGAGLGGLSGRDIGEWEDGGLCPIEGAGAGSQEGGGQVHVEGVGGNEGGSVPIHPAVGSAMEACDERVGWDFASCIVLECHGYAGISTFVFGGGDVIMAYAKLDFEGRGEGGGQVDLAIDEGGLAGLDGMEAQEMEIGLFFPRDAFGAWPIGGPVVGPVIGPIVAGGGLGEIAVGQEGLRFGGLSESCGGKGDEHRECTEPGARGWGQSEFDSHFCGSFSKVFLEDDDERQRGGYGQERTGEREIACLKSLPILNVPRLSGEGKAFGVILGRGAGGDCGCSVPVYTRCRLGYGARVVGM